MRYQRIQINKDMSKSINEKVNDYLLLYEQNQKK